MVVVNVAGFDYGFKMPNGVEIVVPFNKRPMPVPDEAIGCFGKEIRILAPPAPKPVIVVEKSKKKKIIKKVRPKIKPLRGVKIKPKRREEILAIRERNFYGLGE